MKIKIELDERVAENLYKIIGATMSDDIFDICEREGLGNYKVAEEINCAIDEFYSQLDDIIRFKEIITGGK